MHPLLPVTHSFSNKSTPGVEAVLASFQRKGIALRVATVGERFEAGEGLTPAVEAAVTEAVAAIVDELGVAASSGGTR